MTDPASVLEDLVHRCVETGVAPAASAWVWHDGRATAAAAGRLAPGGAEATPRTVFDVASLTKPFCACLALGLVADGRARLDDALDGEATLEDVLAHRAGFAAWAPLWRDVAPRDRGTARGREQVIAAARALPRAHAARDATLYSDIGFILLVPWLERVSRQSLDRAIAGWITGPLGLRATRYGPVVRPVAPTEVLEHRGGLVSGVVHDDNAWAMGGIASHAGLFSTAEEVGRLALCLVEDAGGAGRLLPRKLAARAITAVGPGLRTVGWDTMSPGASSAGRRFGPATFGHLGFTGCSVWADPPARLVAVLLTNRVHPTAENQRIRQFRPLFHDRIFEAMIG